MDKNYLYQPTGNKNIDASNIVVRKSSDRFETMLSFAQEYFGDSLSEKSFLDIGANYGYFVYFFDNYCQEVCGIDRDQKNIDLANIFYPKISKNIKLKNFPKGIEGLKEYDIVCFLSIFQHFIIDGKNEEDLSELIKAVDTKTKHVLFFEMGQEHESWYKEVLSGWNVEKISKWVIENTTFNHCISLMKDEDSVGEFSDRYGRTLFAFYR